MCDDRRILYVVAHPDDEINFAGTAALQARAGLAVTIAVALNGNMGGLAGADPRERAEVRHQEMRQSCEILGAKLEWLGYGDDDFLVHFHNNYAEVEMTFRNLLCRVDPHLLVVPPPNDYHRHHVEVGKIAIDASMDASNANYESEYPASSMIPWTLYCSSVLSIDFVPSLYVDITETYEVKVEALKAHKSQHQYLKDHHRTDIFKNVEAIARYHGNACGVEFAEPFAICRKFNRFASIQQLARFFPSSQR